MLTGLLTAVGLPQAVARVLAPLIAIALAIALVWSLWARGEGFKGERDEARSELSQANAELALLRTDAELKEIAASERSADEKAVAQTEKELIDVIQSIPDTRPDAVRVAVGCERLRQAGYIDAHLPAACRFGSGGEAEARP